MLLIAHRGGEGRWPSNTLHAFNQAQKLNADVLEMDIHTTSDGVLVARHDPTVDSTTDSKGPIRDYSLADLKKLDAGYTWTDDGGITYPFRSKGITIPTLEEIFRAFPETPLNIDIKEKESRSVHLLMEMLNANNRQETVVVGSFHDDQLRLFRRICPHIRTAAGVRETRTFYLLNRIRRDRLSRPAAYAFQVPEYAGRLHLVTPAFINNAHKQGIQVHIWTVNEVPDMVRLIQWGADGIMTDYPDRLAEVLGRES